MAAVRIAVGSVDYDHLGFDGFLKLVAACGTTCVELYPGSVSSWEEDGVHASLSAHGVEVCCLNVTPAFALGSDGVGTEACQAETIRCIALAKRLGAPYVNTYIGPYARRDPLTALRSYSEDVRPVLEAAAQAGVTVLVENLADPRGHDPLGQGLARRPEPLLAVAEAIGPAPWGLTFDAANFRQAGVEGFPYAYRLLRPHIRHVHARDSVRFSERIHGASGDRRILRDSREGEFLGVAVGAGGVNFDGLLATLVQDGYNGHVVIEPHVCPREAESTLRASLRYLRRYVADGG